MAAVDMCCFYCPTADCRCEDKVDFSDPYRGVRRKHSAERTAAKTTAEPTRSEAVGWDEDQIAEQARKHRRKEADMRNRHGELEDIAFPLLKHFPRVFANIEEQAQHTDQIKIVRKHRRKEVAMRNRHRELETIALARLTHFPRVCANIEEKALLGVHTDQIRYEGMPHTRRLIQLLRRAPIQPNMVDK